MTASQLVSIHKKTSYVRFLKIFSQIIKKLGGTMTDSYLDEGFLLDKKIGMNQPKRLENAKIMIANTSMDTDKIKVRPKTFYG